MAAAPPYVSYSSCTFATIPAPQWNYVYGSLQALKGHVLSQSELMARYEKIKK